MSKKVNYLGMEISEEGIRIGDKGLKLLDKIPEPRNKKQIQKIIGILNWFRPFIKNMSQKLSIVTDLLKKNEFVWKENHKEIISRIKKEINEKALLYHVDYCKDFELHCDASDKGIGGALSQENKIVGLFSSKLSQAEQKYSTTEKEALAIIESLKHFKTIIFGSKIRIFTDHSNLKFIHSSCSQKIQRWKTILEEFDTEINYIKGTDNNLSDFLSRDGCNNIKSTEISYIFPLSKEKIIELQQEESFLEELKSLNFIKDTDGLIKTAEQKLIIIPKNWVEDILTSFHFRMGHPGISKTINTVREIYFIPNINKSVEENVKKCNYCIKNKFQINKKGLLEGIYLNQLRGGKFLWTFTGRSKKKNLA